MVIITINISFCLTFFIILHMVKAITIHLNSLILLIHFHVITFRIKEACSL